MASELEKRAAYVGSYDIDDYLDEDPVINQQKFFVLSYILPSGKNELKSPIIKVRGSYPSQEECEKRIEKLKNIDKINNMYMCEVGKYGALIEEEELEKNNEIDVKYREAILNDMVKEYKENSEKKDQEFEDRKKFLKEKAEYEASVKGQQDINQKREHPVSVKHRIESMIAQEKEFTEKLNNVREILKISQEQINNYTEEELNKDYAADPEANKNFR